LDYTQRIAEHVVRSEFRGLSKSTTRAAKRCIRDAIGVALHGSTGAFAKETRRLLRSFGATGTVSLAGCKERMCAPDAAYANAVFSKIPELEDGHRTLAMFHLSPTIVPASLATAERRGLSGADLINAVVAGYDVGVRLGAAMDVCRRMPLRVIPTISCGAIGATAAVGRLLGLNADRMRVAWTISAAQLPMAMSKNITALGIANVGAAARVAVLAPAMANDLSLIGSGLSFEGKDGYCVRMSGTFVARELVRELGKTHPIQSIYFKPYPSCRYTHPAVTAVLGLELPSNLRWDDVSEVHVRVGKEPWLLAHHSELPSAAPLYERQTSNKFSLRYTVATALIHHGLEIEHFEDAVMRSPAIRKLMKKIVISHEPLFDRMPEKMPAAVSVKLKSGKVWSRQIDYPKGEPENPMDETELGNKFRRLASTALPARRVSEIEACLDELESVRDVRQLARMLRL
jgi:2-methylcitrate dehydratase PrpD